MAEQDQGWRQWRAFFAARSARPAPQLLADDPGLDSVPKSVARSLATFQLGESGGGTIVEQARGSSIAAAGFDYAEALALFVAEEHRHAELLACCVRGLRGRLIRSNWTARLFVAARRLLGLRLKVMVLLAAEIVGICYYHLLATRLPDGEIRDILKEIVDDERAHLKFHCCFLRAQIDSGARRLLWVLAWRSLMIAAALVVLIDHRAALRDLSIPFAEAWSRWTVYSRTAENYIVGHRARRLQPVAVR